jgi:hypothetical protein
MEMLMDYRSKEVSKNQHCHNLGGRLAKVEAIPFENWECSPMLKQS